MQTLSADSLVSASQRPRPTPGSTRRPWLLRLWGIYFILLPFYFYKNGTLQVADYMLLALFPLSLLAGRFRMPRELTPALKYLAYFVLYAAVVNLFWGFALNKHGVNLPSLIYVFDSLLLLSCLCLYREIGPVFIRWMLLSVFVSLLFQMALYLGHGGRGENLRLNLFFNNPNQLGHYVLISASMVAIGARWHPFSRAYLTIFFVSALFLTLLTASKAAIFGMVLLMLIWATRRPALVVGGGMVLAILYVSVGEVPGVLEYAEGRLRTTGVSENDTLAVRGYGRIIEYPWHLVFGAGEGAFRRFGSSHEIHSTFGTILFCYGIPGTYFFGTFLLRGIVRRAGTVWIYLLPVAFYQLTHHGLRSRLAWVLVAFAMLIALEEEARANQQAHQHEPSKRPSPSVPIGTAG